MALKIILELLIVAILVGGVYCGIKFGFISIVAKPIKSVVAFVFALTLSSPVGKGIIAPIIQTPVTNYIKDFMYTNCSNLSPNNVLDEIPTLLKISGAIFNVDMNATVGVSADSILESVIYNLTSPVVSVVSIIIAFFLMFFVGKLMFIGGIFAVNKFCSVGILGKVNKAMGFVVSGILAIGAVWLFVSILEFFFHLSIFESSVTLANFRGGLLYRLFVRLSPLELLLSF